MRHAEMNAKPEVEKVRVPDFLRLVEELRALKTHAFTLDLAKLEEQHRAALESAFKAADKRAKSGAPEEIQKLRVEARRVVDDDHERTKEFLGSKFQKLDHNLQALGAFLQSLAPVKELGEKAAAEAERLRKAEEELVIRRKVLEHEKEEVDRDRRLLNAAEQAMVAREKDLAAKVASVDVQRRTKELDQFQQDLDAKVRAYGEQEALLEKQRDELNSDFDKLGQKRAELEKEVEALRLARDVMDAEKQRMADAVARDLAKTFESFVREVLRPAAGPHKPPSAPA